MAVPLLSKRHLKRALGEMAPRAKQRSGEPDSLRELSAGEVAKLLVEFGRRLELSGANRYRAKAYYRAAERLRALARPLAEVIRAGELQHIPGVGDALAE